MGNRKVLHHKNPSRDSASKKDVSSRKRALKSSFLSIKVTLIIKHKVLAFLMLSHEGSLWIGGVLGFLFLHTPTLFQRLFDFHKAMNLTFLRVTLLHINRVVNLTDALATSKKG